MTFSIASNRPCRDVLAGLTVAVRRIIVVFMRLGLCLASATIGVLSIAVPATATVRESWSP